MTLDAHRLLAAALARHNPPAVVGPVCDVDQLVFDVDDPDLGVIFHHGPPCGAPAVATVHTRCDACGYDAHHRACAECAGDGAHTPLEFDGVCPRCTRTAAAHYVITPSREAHR